MMERRQRDLNHSAAFLLSSGNSRLISRLKVFREKADDSGSEIYFTVCGTSGATDTSYVWKSRAVNISRGIFSKLNILFMCRNCNI
jgi:hypothetical protein